MRLEEMEMSEMLDVLHYYMEEDYNVDSKEQIEARSSVRKVIYQTMYNREYRFPAGKNPNTQITASGLDVNDVVSVDPLKGPTKSYVPPTDFNPNMVKPFGNVLDAPLGE